MHSSRSAPPAQLARALERALGQQLAEQHHVGLERLAQRSQRGTPSASRGDPRARLARARRARRTPARAAGDAAVHLDELARARLAVQHVDVLGDHGVEHARALHRSERAVRAVGLLVARASRSARRRSPRSARGRVRRRRCARPPSGPRSPTGRCRACGSRGSRRAPRCRRRSARRPSAPRARARARRSSSGALAARMRLRARARRGACSTRLRPSSASLEVRRAFAEEGRDPLAGVGAREHLRERAASRPRCPRRGRRRRTRA